MSSASIRPNAAEPESEVSRQAVRQFVGFLLHGEEYAVAITKIREIILMKPITRLPQVPESIEGLINLRGHVIPLINLRKHFGLPARPFDDETRTIVVSIGEKTVGCIVDEVTQVMRIASDQIQPVPISMAATAERFIDGLARLDDRLLIILDTDKLFDTREFDLDSGSRTVSSTPSEPSSENPQG